MQSRDEGSGSTISEELLNYVDSNNLHIPNLLHPRQRPWASVGLVILVAAIRVHNIAAQLRSCVGHTKHTIMRVSQFSYGGSLVLCYLILPTSIGCPTALSSVSCSLSTSRRITSQTLNSNIRILTYRWPYARIFGRRDSVDAFFGWQIRKDWAVRMRYAKSVPGVSHRPNLVAPTSGRGKQIMG